VDEAIGIGGQQDSLLPDCVSVVILRWFSRLKLRLHCKYLLLTYVRRYHVNSNQVRKHWRDMTKSVFLTAATVATCAYALMPASPVVAAPSVTASVADTVASLEARGYKVIVNKVGNAELTDCTVGEVRPGRDVTEMKRDKRGRTTERVVYSTVYVNAVC
jgi:hypothetical protein